MKVSIWCRKGPLDTVSCFSRDLDTAIRTMAKKLRVGTNKVCLSGSSIVGTVGSEPIHSALLCRTDKYGTHTIAKISWVKI